MKVLIQIGYRRAGSFGKEGQLIQAWVNEQECSWQRTVDGDPDGKWITPVSKSDKQGWFLWQGDLVSGDIIKINIKTVLVKKGLDEDRTIDMLYDVDDDYPVKEISLQKVGAGKGYPLLKGKIKEIAKLSKSEKREQEIDSYLNEGFED